MRVKSFVVGVGIVIGLSACGGSDDDSSSSGGNGGNGGGTGNSSATLVLSGTDTAQVGDEISLSHYVFRENSNGAEYFLSATTSAISLDFVRAGLGELDPADIDVTAYTNDVANAAVFNIMNFGVSMRINVSGTAYLYSMTCISGSAVDCPNITFDTTARTVTLEDVVVEPTIGGSSDSQATANLILNGVITWSAQDEDANAPAAYSMVPGNPGLELLGDSGIELSNLVGVWNTSAELGDDFDEYYTVITSDGHYIDYDYQGDSYDKGGNCYIREESNLTSLGDGLFRLGDDTDVIFSTSENGLVAHSNAGNFAFLPTTVSEYDLMILCD